MYQLLLLVVAHDSYEVELLNVLAVHSLQRMPCECMLQVGLKISWFGRVEELVNGLKRWRLLED